MTEQKSTAPATTPRRDFLKLATLGAAGAAAAALAGQPATAAETPQTNAGYRETPHVRTYYDSCRF